MEERTEPITRRHVTRPRRRPNKARTRAKGKQTAEARPRARPRTEGTSHRVEIEVDGHPLLIHPDGSGKHCALASTTWTYEASCACVGACMHSASTYTTRTAPRMPALLLPGNEQICMVRCGCLLPLMGERTQLASCGRHDDPAAHPGPTRPYALCVHATAAPLDPALLTSRVRACMHACMCVARSVKARRGLYAPVGAQTRLHYS